MVITNYSLMATRSSLELMLDKIQQLEDQPKDNGPLPLPALPARPVSRARLPTARRLMLPVLNYCPNKSFEENCDGRSDLGSVFEGKKTEGEEALDAPSFLEEDSSLKSDHGVALSTGLVMESAQFDQFLNRVEKWESSSEEIARKGASNIQKCYRGYQVRSLYKELTKGVILLQSFVRGENTRRDYEYTSKKLRAVVIIQEHTRKYFEHRGRVPEDHHAAVTQYSADSTCSRTRRHCNESTYEGKSRKIRTKNSRNQLGEAILVKVPRSILIDLQTRVLRTEAKVREKKEENTSLKMKIEGIEKKWKQYEERMNSMEKIWQDQLTHIQKCLSTDKKNPGRGIKFGRPNSAQEHYTQNSRSLHFIVSSIQLADQNDAVLDDKDCTNPTQTEQKQVSQNDAVLADKDCTNPTQTEQKQVSQKLHSLGELQKLKIRFKAWKKEYKNRLREVQAKFKKIGHNETVNNQKNWWARFS